MNLWQHTVYRPPAINWTDLGSATHCFDPVSDFNRTKLAALAEINRQGLFVPLAKSPVLTASMVDGFFADIRVLADQAP